MNLHAVYANAVTILGDEITFRVGLPVDWTTAQNRWDRLDTWHRMGRKRHVRWMRRQYIIQTFEVRSVDRNGRGQGSERHELAFPIPYRQARRHA